METQSKKKPGRNKQKSPPYQQTEQLVRTALNQGMLAKEIAVLCRVDASIINKWKNGLIKAQTHVLAPLIERFGHAVNRYQLHHFSHVDPSNLNKQKLTEIRGTLIFSWDIKEIYDVDERSVSTRRDVENYEVPRFREFIASKLFLYHRKPSKFIVVHCSPHNSVTTFDEYNTATLQAHITTPQPEVLGIGIYSSAEEALTALQPSLQTITSRAADWLANKKVKCRQHGIFSSYEEEKEAHHLHSKSDLSMYRTEIGHYYTKQLQDAERTLFRQCRLHGFIECGEFLGKEIEVI